VNTNPSTSQPRPLPIRPRPATGENTASYIRRLARANHLRPHYLRRCLRDPVHGRIRLDWLATLAARPVDSLERALADAGWHATPSGRARRAGHKRDKAALLATLRQDADERDQSIRAISDRRGVGRRTVLQALESSVPQPRKRPLPRMSRLDPFTDAIDEILWQDQGNPHQHRRTVQNIMDTLTAKHGTTGISYSTLRDYLASRRSVQLWPRQETTAMPDHDHSQDERTGMFRQLVDLAVAHRAIPQPIPIPLTSPLPRPPLARLRTLCRYSGRGRGTRGHTRYTS
jgi:hypothetical protein